MEIEEEEEKVEEVEIRTYVGYTRGEGEDVERQEEGNTMHTTAKRLSRNMDRDADNA